MKKGKVPSEIDASDSQAQEEKAEPGPAASKGSMKIGADIDKLKLQIETLMQIRTATNERFSRIDEKIGELRGTMAQRAKDIDALKASTAKAVKLVNEVKPEKLVAELQKRDARTSGLESKIGALATLNEQTAKELKDTKKRLQTFKGLEDAKKLSKDVAKDLAVIKTVESKIDEKSDKIEKMFLDVHKKYAEIDNLESMVNQLSDSVTNLTKELNLIKVSSANLVKREEFTKSYNAIEQKTALLKSLSRLDAKSIKELINGVGRLRGGLENTQNEGNSETAGMEESGMPADMQSRELGNRTQVPVKEMLSMISLCKAEMDSGNKEKAYAIYSQLLPVYERTRNADYPEAEDIYREIESLYARLSE